MSNWHMPRLECRTRGRIFWRRVTESVLPRCVDLSILLDVFAAVGIFSRAAAIFRFGQLIGAGDAGFVRIALSQHANAEQPLVLGNHLSLVGALLVVSDRGGFAATPSGHTSELTRP